MKEAAILLVDDEQSLVELLQTVLLKEGFTNIDSASSAEAAVEACKRHSYDIIILDVMLPGRSGIEVTPFLRELTNAPILFLSARSSDFDKLSGFAVGGDDYITKPFNPLEVVARIRSQLRRFWGTNGQINVSDEHSQQINQTKNITYDYGHFQVHKGAGELIVDGKSVACPALVFQLLLFLCQHPNQIFSKRELYEQVWGEDAFNDDNTVMVHIHRIRDRIEIDPANPKWIVNVRGMGYKLVPLRTGNEHTL